MAAKASLKLVLHSATRGQVSWLGLIFGELIVCLFSLAGPGTLRSALA